MPKKLSEISDGEFMKELNIDLKNFEILTQKEKDIILAGIKSNYSSILLKLLDVNTSSIDELSENEQKTLELKGSGKDIFVIVDENDNIVGVEFRALCHNGINTVNKIHRASDWIVVNENQEILMAKRSETKDLYPGYWELGGGHVDGLDTYEETLYRELTEEVNITKNDILKVDPLVKFLQKDAFQRQYLKIFVVNIKDSANILGNEEISGKTFIGESEIIDNISKILDGENPEYKMIPHQIFGILIYLQKKGFEIDELLKKFKKWKNSDETLKEFELDKINIF